MKSSGGIGTLDALVWLVGYLVVTERVDVLFVGTCIAIVLALIGFVLDFLERRK